MAGDIDESIDSPTDPEQRVSEIVTSPALREATNVLVLGPMRRSLDDQVCAACFDTFGDDDRAVVFVTLTQQADERLEILQELVERQPRRVSVVSGVDRVPSTTTLERDDGTTEISVEVVDDPADLPAVGMTISRAVADLAADGQDPLVCFHSLTALLQYVPLERTYRFLNLLQNRIDSTGHYHMDANAHDDQEVATLRSLFDVVVEYDDTGAITISR